MAAKRQIEIFTAGCEVCDDAVKQIEEAACPSCEVSVHDMHAPVVAARARELGIHSLPAVTIDGKLAGCCTDGGPRLSTLTALGLGQPV